MLTLTIADAVDVAGCCCCFRGLLLMLRLVLRFSLLMLRLVLRLLLMQCDDAEDIPIKGSEEQGL